MKKYSFAIMLLVAVMFICGCGCGVNVSLAETATNYSNFALETEKDSASNEVQLFAGEKFDLYSSLSYSEAPALYSFISQNTVYSLLNEYNEYEMLLTLSNAFYNEYKSALKLYENEVPQENKTEIYNSFEEVKKASNNLLSYKKALIELCKNNFTDPDDETVLSPFKKYLKSYQNLIGKVINFNMTFKNIYVKYMAKNDGYNSVVSVPAGEMKRLALTSALEISSYIYQKHMVYAEDVVARFYNSNEFKGLANIRLVLETLAQENQDSRWDGMNNNSDFVVAYKVAREKEIRFENDLQNYKVAVDKLNHSVPAETSGNYGYYEYFVDFDNNALSYANYIYSQISKL